MRFLMRKILWMLAFVVMSYMVFLFTTGQFQQEYMSVVMVCAGVIIVLAIGKLWRKILYFPIRLIRKVLMFWL